MGLGARDGVCILSDFSSSKSRIMVSFPQFPVKGDRERNTEEALGLFMVPLTPEVLVVFP